MALRNTQAKIAKLRDKASIYKTGKGHQEHERDLWVAVAEDGYHGASTNRPELIVTKISPTPRIVNRPLDTVIERANQSIEAVRLQRFMVTRISRDYDDLFLRPLFFLVVPFGTAVTADQAELTGKHAVYTRYKPLGTPEQMDDQWCLTLVEMK